ncbi:hypothetical protein BC358_12085 [Hydrogenophaga sp. H7]|nr:hypothetical protein BC358_12085 [Hydrogenophaga sp. H7]
MSSEHGKETRFILLLLSLWRRLEAALFTEMRHQFVDRLLGPVASANFAGNPVIVLCDNRFDVRDSKLQPRRDRDARFSHSNKDFWPASPFATNDPLVELTFRQSYGPKLHFEPEMMLFILVIDHITYD